MPFRFLKLTASGTRIEQKDEPLGFGGGYDHNSVLNGSGMKKDAEVYEAKAGRVMEVFTEEPGLQFYTGNVLDGTITGKGGRGYQRRAAFCMEMQHDPDSPNKPSFRGQGWIREDAPYGDDVQVLDRARGLPLQVVG